MDSIPVNVVLLPSDELANEAIKASELLAKFGTLFTLKDGSYFPHVSKSNGRSFRAGSREF
jgi:hypothetical protein